MKYQIEPSEKKIKKMILLEIILIFSKVVTNLTKSGKVSPTMRWCFDHRTGKQSRQKRWKYGAFSKIFSTVQVVQGVNQMLQVVVTLFLAFRAQVTNWHKSLS